MPVRPRSLRERRRNDTACVVERRNYRLQDIQLVAVARRPRSGEDRGWQPEQRMTREEALRSFTSWNAYASRQEGELGTLEPGKRADLVVLSDDVLTCPESRIKDVAPVLTMVDGQVVFRAGASSLG